MLLLGMRKYDFGARHDEIYDDVIAGNVECGNMTLKS